MILREDQAKYTLEPAEPPGKRLDISGFWGKATGLTVPPREDFKERPSTIARRQKIDDGDA